MPELIIIDFALPDGSGLAVLGWIRRQAQFDRVPVIILVNPDQDKTVPEAFDRGASAYSFQRDDFAGLARLIRSLQSVSQIDRAEINA